MQHASTASSVPSTSTALISHPRAGVLQTTVGSPTHQIMMFLRHPHLRRARQIDAPTPVSTSHSPGEPPTVIALQLQTVAGSLGARLRLHGALQRGQALHVALAAASALHYLLQNGWSITRLTVDDIMLTADGEVVLDVAGQAAACSMRVLNGHELSLIADLGDRLLAQSVAEPAQRAQERSVFERLCANLERGDDLDRAATLAGCIDIGRPIRFSPGGAFTADPAHTVAKAVSPSDLEPGRRTRRKAAERALRPVRVAQRIRAALGVVDTLLERFIDRSERRARNASENLQPRSTLRRLVSPTAMATALSAVAIVWLVVTS